MQLRKEYTRVSMHIALVVDTDLEPVVDTSLMKMMLALAGQLSNFLAQCIVGQTDRTFRLFVIGCWAAWRNDARWRRPRRSGHCASKHSTFVFLRWRQLIEQGLRRTLHPSHAQSNTHRQIPGNSNKEWQTAEDARRQTHQQCTR